MIITPATFATARVVYTVVVPSHNPDRPFYIGCCRLSQLHELPDVQRNEQWREHVHGATPIRVTILNIYATIDQAERAQAVAVGVVKPWANTHPNKDMTL